MEAQYLGIDPSTASTGYAVLDSQGELLHYGTIKPPSKMPHTERLRLQYETVLALIDEHKITYVYCEDQYGGPNMDTLKKLSNLRGVMMLAAAQKGLPFMLCYPSEWRKLFQGKGNATKEETIDFVNKKYNRMFTKKQNDIADAIGIAAYGAIVGGQSG